MKQTVYKSDFRDAFLKSGRKDSFSYQGLGALYDFLIELEDGTAEEMKLDIIAIDCDFTEYSSADEAACEYSDYEGMTYDPIDGGELETFEEVEENALKFLENRTIVIQFDGGIIIQNF